MKRDFGEIGAPHYLAAIGRSSMVTLEQNEEAWSIPVPGLAHRARNSRLPYRENATTLEPEDDRARGQRICIPVRVDVRKRGIARPQPFQMTLSVEVANSADTRRPYRQGIAGWISGRDPAAAELDIQGRVVQYLRRSAGTSHVITAGQLPSSR